MRVQFVASLALLQLSGFTAAAAGASNKGSNTVVHTGGAPGAAMKPSGHSNQGSKPQGSGNIEGKGGASSHHTPDKNVKGLPRMVDFPGIHISPASGGVVRPSGSVTWDKRTVSSAVPLPHSDLPLYEDCDAFSSGLDFASLPKRCIDNYRTGTGTGTGDIPDPIPSATDYSPYLGGIARSIIDARSATTDKISVPSGLSGLLTSDCPIIGRRGDFLLRRCQRETIGIPVWDEELKNTEPLTDTIAKKRSPTAKEVWTRSDGGESYFECGSMEPGGNFIARRCPEEASNGGFPFDLDTVAKRFMPTAASIKERASSTTERSILPSGLSQLDQCGIMGRGELLVRVVCCDTSCLPSTTLNLSGDGGDLLR